MKSNYFNYLLLATLLLFFSQCTNKHIPRSSAAKGETLQDFFKYTSDGSILISGHRGYWLHTPYPDNSLEGLQYATELIPNVFFEIDPRMTKDSVAVLMHDATLDRTSNGKGKIADYTLEELKQFNLKDYAGNVTNFKITTLEDAIKWSLGKTTLNLDKKNVPMNRVVYIIKACNAEKHIMLTVHNGEQARYYYDRLPDAMISAWIRNEKEYEDISTSGVPWDNMIAYVGQAIDEKNIALVNKLRSHGVRCMVSFSPSHDRKATAEERARLYKEEIDRGPDIIESDVPFEVWGVVREGRE